MLSAKWRPFGLHLNVLWWQKGSSEVHIYLGELAQVMVCRLFGTKQLPETIMIYWQTNPKEYISTKIYLKLKKSNQTYIWKCRP